MRGDRAHKSHIHSTSHNVPFTTRIIDLQMITDTSSAGDFCGTRLKICTFVGVWCCSLYLAIEASLHTPWNSLVSFSLGTPMFDFSTALCENICFFHVLLVLYTTPLIYLCFRKIFDFCPALYIYIVFKNIHLFQ